MNYNEDISKTVQEIIKELEEEKRTAQKKLNNNLDRISEEISKRVLI